jgi:hypothetical protein
MVEVICSRWSRGRGRQAAARGHGIVDAAAGEDVRYRMAYEFADPQLTL